MKLTPDKSLTANLKQIKTREKLDEMSAVKICKYYQHKRVEKSYIGKVGKRIEYTRTTRTDHSEQVKQKQSYLKRVTNTLNIGPMLTTAMPFFH